MAASLIAAAVNSVCTIVVQNLYDQKTLNDIISAAPTAGSPAGGAPDAWGYANALSDFFGKLAAGAFSANIVYADGGATAQAVGTVTFTGNVSSGDKITLQSVDLSWTSGTPSTNQCKLGSTQAASMANMVALINAGGTAGSVAGVCTAKISSTNVITLTAIPPGIVGNTITLAKTAANISGVVAPTGGAALSQSGPISVGM